MSPRCASSGLLDSVLNGNSLSLHDYGSAALQSELFGAEPIGTSSQRTKRLRQHAKGHDTRINDRSAFRHDRDLGSSSEMDLQLSASSDEDRLKRARSSSDRSGDSSESRQSTALDTESSDACRKGEDMRARNRVAAAKARAKRKAWMLDLESDHGRLQDENARLNDLCNSLRLESIQLRAMLIQHGIVLPSNDQNFGRQQPTTAWPLPSSEDREPGFSTQHLSNNVPFDDLASYAAPSIASMGMSRSLSDPIGILPPTPYVLSHAFDFQDASQSFGQAQSFEWLQQ